MEASAQESKEMSDEAVATSSTLELAAQENVPGASKAQAKPRSESRLPQRRKFDRYSQPPLKGAVTSAGVLAK